MPSTDSGRLRGERLCFSREAHSHKPTNLLGARTQTGNGRITEEVVREHSLASARKTPVLESRASGRGVHDENPQTKKETPLNPPSRPTDAHLVCLFPLRR